MARTGRKFHTGHDDDDAKYLSLLYRCERNDVKFKCDKITQIKQGESALKTVLRQISHAMIVADKDHTSLAL